MKNIILQHWTGEMNELGKLSSTNIQRYAKKVGTDYKLLQGNIFHPKLSPPCQKLHMLSDEFDEYDMVVMLDIDMFERKGMTENIFTDVEGVGMYAEIQQRLFRGLQRKHGGLTNPKYPYWGGAVYRLDKDLRQRLREHINIDVMKVFSGQGNYEDEGMMHYLASQAKVEYSKLPGEFKWCHCSYREGIENAGFIHIRTKITPTGPKRTKIENYNDMIKRGLIEP